MSIDSKKATNKPFYTLVLASGSPRRKELLSQLEIDFEIVAPEVDELLTHPGGASSLVLENACIKARSVTKERPDQWVLGADTVVALNGDVLGKPVDMDQARSMLQRLSGKTHQVHTGLCLMMSERGVERKDVITSLVTFQKLDESRIASYLDKVNPMDKAGGYAMQTHPDLIVESLIGSRTNVIGLPMETITGWLKDAGFL